jgi:hypothetical protein
LILSKFCHDLDILRWTIGKPCRRISSFGSLRLFKAEESRLSGATVEVRMG